jgi:hypothetical protein
MYSVEYSSRIELDFMAAERKSTSFLATTTSKSQQSAESHVVKFVRLLGVSVFWRVLYITIYRYK